MIRLAANLSTLFTELPFLERFAAAKAAGFAAVECSFPMKPNLRRWLQGCTPPASNGCCSTRRPARPVSGGIASLPGREREFDASIEVVARYVAAGACAHVHVMAGLLPQGAARARHLDCYVASIGRTADRLAALGATVMIEPINTRVDVPGYLLDFHRAGAGMHGARGAPNIRLQYDVYHMQIMEGDLLRSIGRLLPHIGHIQIADNPGRHEPGTGEIAFERLLPGIDALGYNGYIGCEYLPAAGTMPGLAWAEPWLGK